MSDVLKPWREIAAEVSIEQLAVDVNSNVNDPNSAEMFERRRLNGVRKRHPEGALQQSAAIIDLALLYEEIYGYYDLFAVIDPDTEQNVGSATIFHTLTLRENHRVFIPTPLARKTDIMERMNGKYRLGSNVTAWVIGGFEELLEPAYRELVELHTDLEKAREAAAEEMPAMLYGEVPARRAWTIEPLSAPENVRRAIESSGMECETDGRFDDGELGMLPYPTPRSTLYLSPPLMLRMPTRFDPSELSVVIRNSL